jgi:hypothetical protein
LSIDYCLYLLRTGNNCSVIFAREYKSNNTGIPDAEVILLVETWLDKIRENFKQPIKDGFTSFQPPKDDDK